MSGTYPNWYKKGLKVNYKGKSEIIKDCFFTSTGCHNDDNFNVSFESGISVNTNKDKSFYAENNDFRPTKYRVIETSIIDDKIQQLEKLIKKSNGEGINFLETELKIWQKVRDNSTFINEHIDKTWDESRKNIFNDKTIKKTPNRLINPTSVKGIIANWSALQDFKLKNGY